MKIVVTRIGSYPFKAQLENVPETRREGKTMGEAIAKVVHDAVDNVARMADGGVSGALLQFEVRIE